MKSFRGVGALAALVAATIAGSACGGGGTTTTGLTAPCSKAPYKIGLVTDVGKLADKSFNFDSYNGVLDAQADSGLGVQGRALESSVESDYPKNIQTFLDQKYCMIITVGFKLGDATIKAAKANPNVAFAMVDFADFTDLGKPSHPGNLVGLEFQEDQPGFLAGALAGLMTKTNVIGAVAGLQTVPPVVRYVKGYENGAKYTNPKIKVLSIYQPESGAKDFNDPDWGKQQALTFFGQGADVIFGVGGNTGNGAILAAKEAGKMCIGVDVDQYVSYPDVDSCLITSAQIRLRQSVKAAIVAFIKGAWQPGLSVGNITNDGIGLAPYHDFDSKIPADVKATIATIMSKLKDGSLKTGV
jgi:basic membrane protein A and related proteins